MDARAATHAQASPPDDQPPVARPAWLDPALWEEVESRDHLSQQDRRRIVRLAGILSAYAVRDPEVGYCQGMSDLAAAFVLVIPDDDALAFWCFERLMRSARHNFKLDDMGFRAVTGALMAALQDCDLVLAHQLRQLGAQDCMFAFRMVLCRMRRELPLPVCLQLWEAVWADEVLRVRTGTCLPLCGRREAAHALSHPLCRTWTGSAAGFRQPPSCTTSRPPASALQGWGPGARWRHWLWRRVHAAQE